ncbi:7333_t:CDS:1, partial [Funneliformis caledonium]
IDNQQSKSKRSYKKRQKVDLSLPQTIAELLKDDGINYKNNNTYFNNSNDKEILQQGSLETERNSRL